MSYRVANDKVAYINEQAPFLFCMWELNETDNSCLTIYFAMLLFFARNGKNSIVNCNSAIKKLFAKNIFTGR